MLLVDASRHPRLDEQLQQLGRAECVPPRFGRAASRDELRAAAPVAAAKAWVQQAREGHCGVTSFDAPSDCAHGDKGVLGLLPQEVETPLKAARACLARCAACERCRFVSLSRRLADCSWYSSCDLSRLGRGTGFAESGKRRTHHSGPALPRNRTGETAI